MSDILLGVIVFSSVILLLVIILNVLGDILLPQGEVKLLINDDLDKSINVQTGGTVLSALAAQNAGTAAYNVAVGFEAGLSVTTGTHNVLLGGLAGDALTEGTGNVAIGYQALSSEDGHGTNVAIGHNSLATLNAGADAYNIAVGYNAGMGMTTGINNTILGGLSCD